MKTNITKENLIQFIYGEISPDMHLFIMDALGSNPEIKKQYSELMEDINSLRQLEFSPSKTTIKLLLEKSSESSQLEGIA